MPNVELAVHEVLSRGIDQLLVDGGLASEIVHGVDDTDAKVMPQMRLTKAGEERLSDLRSHWNSVSRMSFPSKGSRPGPSPVGPPGIRVFEHFRSAVGHTRGRGTRGSGRLTSSLGLSATRACGFGRLADRHGAEDVGVGTIVRLGPAVEGVLVALGALDADAHERRRRAFAPLLARHRLPAPPIEVEGLPLGVVGVVTPEELIVELADLLHPGFGILPFAAGGA